MIIYNVTVSVENTIKDDWLKWMMKEHVPEVLGCGLFLKAQINQVFSESDVDSTFAIAYTASSLEEFKEYKLKYASQLKEKHITKFGNKTTSFRTLMNIIKEF